MASLEQLLGRSPTGTDMKFLLQAGNNGVATPESVEAIFTDPGYADRYAQERAAYEKRHKTGMVLGAAGLAAPLVLPALGVGAAAGAGAAGGATAGGMTAAEAATLAGLTEGGGVAAGGAAAGGAAATAGSSALGRIISGTATMEDYLSVGGKAAPALLGLLGSKQQAGALQAQADRFAEYGGPSRARFEASMSPGFDPMSIPGYSGAVDSASKSVLARLSATGGNPFGNPGGIIDAEKQVIAGTALPAIQNYQNLNSGAGFGATLGASGSFGRDAIGAEANMYNAVGAGINDVVNPPQTLAEQLKAMKAAGLYSPNSL